MYNLNHINRLFMNLTKQLLAMMTLSIPVRQQWKMLYILVNLAIQSQHLVTGGCLGVFLGKLDHHLKKDISCISFASLATFCPSHMKCSACLFVGWLLNVPATCECISGTDLLRQFYVLPH